MTDLKQLTKIIKDDSIAMIQDATSLYRVQELYENIYEEIHNSIQVDNIQEDIQYFQDCNIYRVWYELDTEYPKGILNDVLDNDNEIYQFVIDGYEFWGEESFVEANKIGYDFFGYEKGE